MRIQIQEPCSESWDQMVPGEGGRFCGSCQKTVRDFSNMTDAELIRFFQQPGNGNTCARIRTEQLDRPLIGSQPISNRFWGKWSLALLGIWTGFVAEAGDFVGKNPVGKKTIQTKSQTPVSKTKKKKRPQRKKVDLVEVVGRVRSETKAMVGCLVELDSGKYSIRTDSMGIFRIRIPKARLAKAIVSVNIEGYEPWKKNLSAFAANEVLVNLKQTSQSDEILIGLPNETTPTLSGMTINFMGAPRTHYSRGEIFWFKVKRFFGWKPKWD